MYVLYFIDTFQIILLFYLLVLCILIVLSEWNFYWCIRRSLFSVLITLILTLAIQYVVWISLTSIILTLLSIEFIKWVFIVSLFLDHWHPLILFLSDLIIILDYMTIILEVGLFYLSYFLFDTNFCIVDPIKVFVSVFGCLCPLCLHNLFDLCLYRRGSVKHHFGIGVSVPFIKKCPFPYFVNLIIKLFD